MVSPQSPRGLGRRGIPAEPPCQVLGSAVASPQSPPGLAQHNGITWEPPCSLVKRHGIPSAPGRHVTTRQDVCAPTAVTMKPRGVRAARTREVFVGAAEPCGISELWQVMVSRLGGTRSQLGITLEHPSTTEAAGTVLE